MTTNNLEPNTLLSEDEIDLREVFAAFRRRWIWVASGGLIGLGIAAGVSMSRLAKEPLKTIRMIVDVTQSPCASQNPRAWTPGKLEDFKLGGIFNIECPGEFMATRNDLATLAFNEFGSDLVGVRPLIFGNKRDIDHAVSDTQIELVVKVRPGELGSTKDQLENIKDVFTAKEIAKLRILASDVQVSKDWFSIENVLLVNQPKPKSFNRSLALGLLGGLVAGSGAALIADRRSNRVFSNSKILSQLGYPLWLTLPTLPWPDQVAGPLIGQLAARLDRSLEWHVLSVAREHEAVGPLAQALIRQNEAGLSCKSVEPLMNSIIRLGSDSRPIGLLVVVESGFNSSQALEDARLLLSQLSCVQSIGVVLAGVPLPSELREVEKA